MCIDAKQLIPQRICFNCCRLTYRISRYRNTSLQGSWQKRWGEVPNVKTERINTEELLRPVKAFSLNVPTSAFEHKTSSNSAEGSAMCQGGKKKTIAAGYTIEHIRVNAGSWLPPLAKVRQAQASVTGFRSGGEGLCLVVSQSSQLVFVVLLLWQSFHLKDAAVQHQSYFRWVLVGGVQLSGWSMLICNPIS